MALTKAQLKDRHKSIGGSQAAAACGVNPYQSAKDLWMEYMGLVEPFAGNEATYWGEHVEPLIIQRVREEHPEWTIITPRKTFRHGEHRFMTCHLDAEYCGGLDVGSGLIEAKTMRYPPKSIYEHYYMIQIQHCLYVTGYRKAVLAVLVGGNEYQEYAIDRDETMIAHILTLETKFWQAVKTKTPLPEWGDILLPMEAPCPTT